MLLRKASLVDLRELLPRGIPGQPSLLAAKQDPYPAKRNPEFQLEREDATGYNIFYKIGARGKKAVRSNLLPMAVAWTGFPISVLIN